jgi:hypothetical protein
VLGSRAHQSDLQSCILLSTVRFAMGSGMLLWSEDLSVKEVYPRIFPKDSSGESRQ